MTKIILTLALAATLTACGKKKPAAAPENTETQNTTQGAGATGGASYGGSSYGAQVAAPAP